MVRPVQNARRRPTAATSVPPETGSIREVRLLGVREPGAAPTRRAGTRLEWAGRAYRVADHQREPHYLHLELDRDSLS